MPRGRSPPSHSRTTTGSASGNQTLELRYDGENHARGNIYIYAPAQKLLVLIDVVFPRLGPLRVPGRQQQHLRLDRGARQGAGVRLRIPCQRVLGHARRRAGAEGVHAGPASCKQGLDLTTTLPSAAVLQGAVGLMNPGNPWAVFRGYPAVVVEHCGNATKKWVGRLGAADVLGIRHAWMMVES